MKSKIKQLLPAPALVALRRLNDARQVRADFRADRRRYRRFASEGDTTRRSLNYRQREAQLTKDYHRVEKGMALPTPKRPFGVEVLARLDHLLGSDHVRDDSAHVRAARDAQLALRAWNAGEPLSNILAPQVDELSSRHVSQPSDFFGSRHSVRHFSDDIPSTDLLKMATRAALSSPSVCNRQPWLVRYFSGDEVPRILAHQNGNRGFTDNVPVVALVSVDVALFGGSIERNQAWIEGGIFASSLVWSLHAHGLDTCMLNLSMTTRRADALRKAAGMSENEVPIMMVAIGHAATGHRRARSPRRDLAEVVVRLPDSSNSASTARTTGGER